MPKKRPMDGSPARGSVMGDNEPESKVMTTLDKGAKDKLRTAIKRIEKLTDEKKETSTEITEAFKELRSLGYDTKAIRRAIKERADRAKDEDAYDTLLAVTDLYLSVF